MKASASIQPVQGNAIAEYWHERGEGLARLWKLAASEVCFQKALQVQDRPDYRANYANCLRRALKLDDAMREARRAFDEMPEGELKLSVQGILGTLYADKGNSAKAMRLLEEPAKTSHFHRFAYALAALHDGQWEKGFAAYESRLEKANPVYRMRPWRGEDLTGKVLAVAHEQGFGDTIMYSRFLDHLPEGTDFLLGVPSPLARLLQGKYGDRVRSAHSQLVADYAVPIMSLPYWLGMKDTGTTEPYLKEPTPFVGLPKPPMTKLSIGLVWQSKSGGRDLKPEEEVHGARKSIPLELLLPLAGLPGVSLFALQTGDACKDIDRLVAGDIIHDLGWQTMDFADLAGFMGEMDLIVSIDSAPAHLAGAMGKPTIVMVPYVGAWQWGSGDRSLWYPSVQIVRQERPFDWKPVAEQVARMVASRL